MSDVADLGNNFHSILNTHYPMGVLIFLRQSQTSETASISGFDNVSLSPNTASASSTSLYTTDNGSTSTAGELYRYKKDVGIPGLVILIFGYVYIYGY